MPSFRIVPLQTLLNVADSDDTGDTGNTGNTGDTGAASNSTAIDQVKALLLSFKCSYDPDIENFLHNRAIDFEKSAKARTYLLCDDGMKILAYFALSLKVLILPEEMSVRGRKEYDGFSGKIHGQPVREIPCYLIGQLARDDDTNRDSLTGSVIMDAAMSIITASFNGVGGRWVIIECHNTQPLIDFYEKNAFRFIMERPSEDVPMVQMIRKLI